MHSTRTRTIIAALALTLATSGMALAEKVDTGVASQAQQEAAPDMKDAAVLKAAIMQDGKEIEHHYFGQQGETVIFVSAAKCAEFQTLPFFPQIRAQLDAFVAHAFPGATSVLTCEPPPSE